MRNFITLTIRRDREDNEIIVNVNSISAFTWDSGQKKTKLILNGDVEYVYESVDEISTKIKEAQGPDDPNLMLAAIANALTSLSNN